MPRKRRPRKRGAKRQTEAPAQPVPDEDAPAEKPKRTEAQRRYDRLYKRWQRLQQKMADDIAQSLTQELTAEQLASLPPLNYDLFTRVLQYKFYHATSETAIREYAKLIIAAGGGLLTPGGANLGDAAPEIVQVPALTGPEDEFEEGEGELVLEPMGEKRKKWKVGSDEYQRLRQEEIDHKEELDEQRRAWEAEQQAEDAGTAGDDAGGDDGEPDEPVAVS